MDKLLMTLRTVTRYAGKAVYVISAIAIVELVYVYVLAMYDGHITNEEALRLKDATTRVVETLPSS